MLMKSRVIIGKSALRPRKLCQWMRKRDAGFSTEPYICLCELIPNEIHNFDKAAPYVMSVFPSARSRTAPYLQETDMLDRFTQRPERGIQYRCPCRGWEQFRKKPKGKIDRRCGVGSQSHTPVALLLEESSGALVTEAGCASAPVWMSPENSPPPGFEPRPSLSVLSHCTDYAVPAAL
jgi:hypothetical protein